MKMWAHTRDSREDLAFTCFVIHEEELNEIIDKICNGELHPLSCQWLSYEDICYIEKEVEKRLGASYDLSL
jgi:hypothetical protein